MKENRVKKILITMLAIILTGSCLVFASGEEAVAAKKTKSTLTIKKGYSYPERLPKGTAFTIKGTVTSNYKIKSVTAGIYDKNGKKLQSKKIESKEKKVNFGKAVTEALHFEELNKGTYYYKVSATDRSGKKKTLVKKEFSIVSALHIKKGYTYPEKLETGEMFTLEGKIACGVKISSVTAGIYTQDGKKQQQKTIKPKAKTASLLGKIDDSLIFGKLDTGTYVYKVKATDECGNNKTLVNKTFEIYEKETGIADELPDAGENADGDINASDIFLKQSQRGTCTLCASAMMLRRKAVLLGKSYKDITEASLREVAWVEGVGIYHNFTFKGMKVSSASFGGMSLSAKKAKLIALLKEHPEGIVIHDYGKPHAVLLTDYDAEKDIFYIADPSGDIQGRTPIENSLATGSGQNGKIESLDKYWYVSN